MIKFLLRKRRCCICGIRRIDVELVKENDERLGLYCRPCGAAMQELFQEQHDTHHSNVVEVNFKKKK